ncbi:unnamed protein product [Didymodactylos carnosus]|uniref:Ras guanyl-releasing protein 3 n=1 Tax=Didymodactylos carnosus TaxID=1234261 RepID=A0A813Y5S5_9BILA|nr:unnamed protein product [Didymodactylos carnosus]CAF1154099.1 unnamed protein product [Didymodactylos carnosus]CAF3665082.1 unnamed protein product [Didymodactylos carnosus]CAF3963739.1 unnamed protein product [Didymodactylos carnosus]
MTISEPYACHASFNVNSTNTIVAPTAPFQRTMIKRSQAIPNIQDMDENSPVTFEIDLEPIRKKQIKNELQNYTIWADDESDNRSESSEKPPEYIEEDKPVVLGIYVKAATINRLLRILIDSFNSNGLTTDDSEYPKVFFLMHKWIMESEQLGNMFYDLYKNYGDECKKTMDSFEKRQYKDYQLKICHAYRYWIKNFPFHFDLDRRLKETAERMKILIQSTGNSECMKLVDVSQIPSFEWMRKMTVRNQPKTSKIVSLGFNNIESQTLAAQLTYLEWKTLRRIAFTDYKMYAMKATLQDNPKLERSIQFFNGLSTWIMCMVLSKTTAKQRAEIIHKFLDVAKYLKELQNFNTFMAVIGGISHSSVARLSKTMACLSQEDHKMLSEMTELLSSNCNYAQYRKALSECEGFKIPIIGVHLKDIISLHVALADKLENDLINFRKIAQLSLIFKTLTDLQTISPPVAPNHDLINLLTLSLDLSYTEDEIYELSLAREPRSSVSSPTTPTKCPVFADWAAGVSSPLDIQTIQKHVNAMVEAVFTNYDHDRDGYISHTEFDEIAQNFPFIDTFTVLDADQDGMISKGEMRSYFLRAKYHDLKGEFKHDFHETTYFKPTFCTHCTGLLWGLIKQGWKCKDCGINAHRHCKDMVVMECRSKRTQSVHKQGSVSDSRTSRHSFRIRKACKQKATQTDDLNFSSSSGTSESCTTSSDDEPQPQPAEKASSSHYWNLRKPTSFKLRKQLLSDSNEDYYYYTHPTSPLLPQPPISASQQLIPRGPLICSDSFDKWSDSQFPFKQQQQKIPLASATVSTSTTTSDCITISTMTTTSGSIKNEQDEEEEELAGEIGEDEKEGDDNGDRMKRKVSRILCQDVLLASSHDENEIITKNTFSANKTMNYGSSQDVCRKLNLTDSLHSLPTISTDSPTQLEIYERLRQAEEEKKRLEVENAAMKQELVRTKSKISSLKREMSSIQQLHLQQQHHVQQTSVSSQHENDQTDASLINKNNTSSILQQQHRQQQDAKDFLLTFQIKKQIHTDSDKSTAVTKPSTPQLSRLGNENDEASLFSEPTSSSTGSQTTIRSNLKSVRSVQEQQSHYYYTYPSASATIIPFLSPTQSSRSSISYLPTSSPEQQYIVPSLLSSPLSTNDSARSLALITTVNDVQHLVNDDNTSTIHDNQQTEQLRLYLAETLQREKDSTV